MRRLSRPVVAIPERIRFRLSRQAAIAMGTRSTPMKKAEAKASSATGMATPRTRSRCSARSSSASCRYAGSGEGVSPRATRPRISGIGLVVSQPARIFIIP
jgi:hypothetical protein